MTLDIKQQVVKAVRQKKTWSADECRALCVAAGIDYQDGDESNMVQFVASTETADREGDVMRIAGMDSKNFMSNPVFLYVHDYESIPIGAVLKLDSANKTLLATVIFHSITDIARDLLSLCKAGFLRAVSIGFQGKPGGARTPTDQERTSLGMRNYGVIYESWELLEISLCPIGMNPEALQVRGLTKKTIDLLSLKKNTNVQTVEESLNMTPEELQKAIDEGICKGVAMAVTGCDFSSLVVKSGDEVTPNHIAAMHEAHKSFSKALTHMSAVVQEHPVVPTDSGARGPLMTEKCSKSLNNAIMQGTKAIVSARGVAAAHEADTNDHDEDDKAEKSLALLKILGEQELSPLEKIHNRLTATA